jgi:acyl-CoA synthetase (AMP-forming)/AMP-acid ligase II
VRCEHKFLIGAQSDAQLLRYDRRPRPWEPDEDATATINYTSGTTARPRCAAHPSQFMDQCRHHGLAFGCERPRRLLTHLAQFHCNGWGLTYAVTGMGGKHVIVRKIDGAEILRRIAEHGVTLMAGPRRFSTWCWKPRSRGKAPSRERQTAGSGGGSPPPTRTIERIESELGWEFIQIYGLTETAPLLTVNRASPNTTR